MDLGVNLSNRSLSGEVLELEDLRELYDIPMSKLEQQIMEVLKVEGLSADLVDVFFVPKWENPAAYRAAYRAAIRNLNSNARVVFVDDRQ